MAQRPKIIDLTKSMVITDPNAFPENLRGTEAEDSPDRPIPILAYEGWNVLPTSYGYKSYFGLTSTLNIDALPDPRCDYLLVFQNSSFQNILVALCETGIYLCRPNTAGADWNHILTYAAPASGIHYEWTWTIIENKLYLYQQGRAHYHYIDPTDVGLAIHEQTPTFLTMSGQMGIFNANGRLGFWDSANSVSWSDLFDFQDFTPSVQTLVGNTIFSALVGRIVTIKSLGEGFVIYATKSIVSVQYTNTGTLLWEPSLVSDKAGIAYPRQVCVAQTDKDHYVYCNGMLYRLGSFSVVKKSHDFEPIFTAEMDFLRKNRDPIYLDCLGARYVFFSLISDTYINGLTTFEQQTVDPLTITLYVNNDEWDGTFSILPTVIPGNVIIYLIGNILEDPGSAPGMLHKSPTQAEFWTPRYVAVVDNMSDKIYSVLDRNVSNVALADAGLATTAEAIPTLTGAQFLTYADDMNTQNVSPTSTTHWYSTQHTISNARPAFKNGIPYAERPLNCLELLAMQYHEWEELAVRQAANIAALRSIGEIQRTVTTETIVGTMPADPADVITYDDGTTSMITGEGNNKILWNGDEVVARKYFQRAYTPSRKKTVQVHYSAGGSGVSFYKVVNLQVYFHFQQVDFHYVDFRVSAAVAVSTTTLWPDICTQLVARLNSANITARSMYQTVGGTYGGSYLDVSEVTFSVVSSSHDPQTFVLGISMRIIRRDKFNAVIYNEVVTATLDMLTNTQLTGANGNFTNGPFSVYTTSFNGMRVPAVSAFTVDASDQEVVIRESYTIDTQTVYNDIDQTRSLGTLGRVFDFISVLPYGTDPLVGRVSRLTSHVTSTQVFGAYIPAFVISSNSNPIFYKYTGYTFPTDDRVSSINLLDSFQPATSFAAYSRTLVASELTPYTKTTTTIYESDTTNETYTNGQYGYAEARFTLSHWDHYRVEDDGSYTLLETTVPAPTTPLAFDNAYPSYSNTAPITFVEKEGEVTAEKGGWFPLNSTIGKLGPFTTSYSVNVFVEPPSVVPGYDLEGLNTIFPTATFDVPGATFLLQDGSPAPIYPDFVGAVVYDLHLKKWTKFKGSYRQLVEVVPVNQLESGAISYDQFGMDAGILSSTGVIKIFTEDSSSDNNIRYGKIGYYRLGFTQFLEARIHFSKPSTGTITLDSSIDGISLDPSLSYSESFTSALSHVFQIAERARWFTISISGDYDLQFLEFRANISGTR